MARNKNTTDLDKIEKQLRKNVPLYNRWRRFDWIFIILLGIVLAIGLNLYTRKTWVALDFTTGSAHQTPSVSVTNATKAGAPSADNTLVPPAPSVTDNYLNAWTIGKGNNILKNSLATSGFGSKILWHKGTVYIYGTDNNWYSWINNSYWTYVGPNSPDGKKTARPTISINPSSLTFIGISGGGVPSAKSIKLSNTGTALLNFKTSTSASWCHPSPDSGSIGAGKTMQLSISVDAPSNVGTFGCTVTISDVNASNTPQTINAVYSVGPAQ